MTRQQLILEAYDAIGYRPTRDDCVYNDRIAALEKKSDKELRAIIETRNRNPHEPIRTIIERCTSSDAESRRLQSKAA